MKKEFKMGNSDWLLREVSKGLSKTYITPRLQKKLIAIAVKEATEFYCDFFNAKRSDKSCDYMSIAYEYGKDYEQAVSLGLFQSGGIREKDHLSLWCLCRTYQPDMYIESGVFIGSSMHAFISSPSIKKIVAIDPNLKSLKIPKQMMLDAEFVDDKDFSELELEHDGLKSLVYFDDHIDTASRIQQASSKGFKYVIFDDSTGFEGVCQRLYPAIPTIPMIMNVEALSEGDELSWSFRPQRQRGFKSLLKKVINTDRSTADKRVSLVIDKEFIIKCHETKKLIKRCIAIPDLGKYIPQPNPEKMVDISKYLVELH